MPCAQRVAVAYAAIHGKHGDVDRWAHLTYVVELSQEPPLLFGRVHPHAKLVAVDGSGRVVGNETGIPVADVASVEKAFPLHLHHPAHPAVVASCGRHANVVVVPLVALLHPSVGSLLGGTMVVEDVAR